ncbi:hypothetical protein B0W48_02665 [Pseudoalteromonas aliena]|uniref:Type I restriction modification DNA specificity domain-containing protein n=1 Tax=Pseudoalteromonas aliena TaxID=247523 RepID=A0A1Q2GUL1_9GAMM|nr:restriction endonuclease subunit S [Pseudoalteromonas aliena]AQP98796.1 hypothetical protein B0W48_02665 [Pseudoalteromonas aliena]
MGSNWKTTTTLADISERIGDGLHGTPKYSDDGEYYFVNGNNLESGAIVYKDSTKRVGLEEYNKHKKELGSSTVLVSINGTIGNVALYNGEEVVLGKSACYINLKKGISKEFVKYILSGYLFQEYIQRCSTGSTIKNVSLKMMRDFAFRIPDTGIEQDKAVELLKLLDHKISLNNQTNQTLEQMAQALFKSWFVDFDPVFDNLLASVDFKLENLENRLPDELKQKAQRRLAALDSLENAAECKASLIALDHELQAQTQAAEQVSEKAAETPVKANFNANPKILAQHANTHAHFPNEFEHNEQLGWIPKGWDIKAVSETIQINPRTSLSKGAIAKFADMKSIPTSGYMVDEIIEKAFSGGVKFKRNDILLARITPCLQNGKTAWVDFLKEDEVGFGSTEFIVLRENNNISFPFIACLAKGDSFRAHCMQSMVGSSGRQRVQNACFDSYYLALPKSDVLKDMFTELTKPNFKKMTNNKLESESLTKLRDTLLPKLISGELQIPDVATDDETVD